MNDGRKTVEEEAAPAKKEECEIKNADNPRIPVAEMSDEEWMRQVHEGACCADEG